MEGVTGRVVTNPNHIDKDSDPLQTLETYMGPDWDTKRRIQKSVPNQYYIDIRDPDYARVWTGVDLQYLLKISEELNIFTFTK